ncbi:MAG: ATP-binding protein [Halohasta sp.]
MGSQLEGAVEHTRLVVEETTTAGMNYLDDTATSPVCVVTDHDPPERDCFELLDAVPPEIPVVLAPNDGNSSLATRGLQAGAVTYLDPTTVDNGAATLAAEIDRIAADRPRQPAASGGSDERIKQFTSIVSHELRSPIQTARSGIDLATAQCDSEYLEEVAEAIDRMDELIDTLLDDFEHGETAVDLEAVDLTAVVEEAWPEGTTATLSVESELPTIEAEHTRLRQLFDNLFRNSIQHGGDEITVRIGRIDSAEDSGNDSTAIYVADDGQGIEPDRHEAVFEYGYSGSPDGTGFGLAIVAEIVDGFNWEIDVTESRDGGARFELRNVKIA